MQSALLYRLSFLALLFLAPCAVQGAQQRTAQNQAAETEANGTGSPCPKYPGTLRAMRDCYRPLLVFTPAMNDPQLEEQLHQLENHGKEMRRRGILCVPIVPEGHNQPIPDSEIPTANLGEDELAAARHRVRVARDEFLVVLIGKDGKEKLRSRTPLSMTALQRAVDAVPADKKEVR